MTIGMNKLDLTSISLCQTKEQKFNGRNKQCNKLSGSTLQNSAATDTSTGMYSLLMQENFNAWLNDKISSGLTFSAKVMMANSVTTVLSSRINVCLLLVVFEGNNENIPVSYSWREESKTFNHDNHMTLISHLK